VSNGYTSRHEKIDPGDPFFNVGLGDSGTDEKSAEKTKEYLYRE
jgi:hypothetical protein